MAFNVKDYEKDYMAEINRRAKLGETSDNSQELRDLIAARTAKINGNSDLQQYADQQIGEEYLDPTHKVGQGTGQTAYMNTKTAALQLAPQPTVTDNSGLINSQYSSLIDALRTRLQQNIANRKAASQPLRNNSEVQKANELRMVLEQNANAGDRGGIGRQNALNTQTAGENRLISINNAEASDISNMKSDANVQEAQTNAENLRALIENNRYMDETAYNRSQNTFKNNLALDQFNYSKEQDALQRATEQKAAEAAAQGATAKALYDRAWQQFETVGRVTSPEMAQILGLPVGTTTNDFRKTSYDLSKPYYKPSSGTPSVSQQNADNKAAAQQLSGNIMTYLDQWASGKAEDRPGNRADQNDMLNYLKANSGILTSQGVDINELMQWVKNNYTWMR